MEHWGKVQISVMSSTCGNAGHSMWTATLAESHHLIWWTQLFPHLTRSPASGQFLAIPGAVSRVDRGLPNRKCPSLTHMKNFLDAKCHKGRNLIINSNKLLLLFIRHLSQAVVATRHVPLQPRPRCDNQALRFPPACRDRRSPWTLRAVQTRLDDT